jgi:predicted phage terminase large subunit-like protein
MKKEKGNKKMGFEEIIDVMLRDRRVRLNIVKRNHRFFFYYYFPHYTEFEIAPFQEEIFHITQNTAIPTAVIIGFRGCGKSVLLSLSFPLWAILGEQKIKYVLILSQTQQKAQMLLQQIKYELETNNLLKKDLGPFQEERNQWNIVSLHLTRYNAKITVASAEQSIRSWRHMQYRPQLIICDDPEDLESVKTKEGRDKLYNWLIGDVIPAGNKNTRLLIVGGLLHEDSLPRRLQKSIIEGKMDGIYREYPLLDEKGNPTWPGKFRTIEDVEAEKRKIGNDIAWQREYLLRIIPDEDQLIHQEWIHFYHNVPDEENSSDFRFVATGVDLAISESATADFTAMVSARVFGHKNDLRIYILPSPVNERLDFPETLARAKAISRALGNGMATKLYIENVGYQKSLIDQLNHENYPAEEFKLHGNDKRARLSLTTHLIQSGKILFPKEGAEQLIEQLVGFGIEKYDDLVDAFAILILKIMETDDPQIPGYTPFVTAEDLEKSYAQNIPHFGDKFLGIVFADQCGRKYSVIVLRSETAAEVLYKSQSANAITMAEKTIGFIKEYNITPDFRHIIPERIDTSNNYFKIIGDDLLQLRGSIFGINPSEDPELGEKEFANLISQCYIRMAKWIKTKGGKFVKKSDFYELLTAQYKLTENGKIKVVPREELMKLGYSLDIADAFAMTFARTVYQYRKIIKLKLNGRIIKY